MIYSDDTQRQMEEIWRLTTSTDAGQQRLAKSSEPWLIENALRPDGKELRIKFPDGRSKSDLPFWERTQRFLQAKKYLYMQASIARSKASSWRDFHVGSAVLAFREGYRHEDSWGIFTGMNIKFARNMRPTCSEPIALGAAIMNGFDLIIGIVVVGEQREEDIGKFDTLHPCQDCRWCMHGYMYEENQKLQIIDDHTIVHTAFPSESEKAGISETRSFNELLAFHRSISEDNFK